MTRLKAFVRLAVATLALTPAMAHAHAVVLPKNSAPGAYEKYVLRVPNEKGVPTTRIEIRFPSNIKVVSFSDVDGWTLEQIRDSSNAIIGAVWTGSLAPERFVEFPFVAVNPKETATLTWPVFQTYTDNERVAWTGPEGSEKPASSTAIAPATPNGPGRLSLYLSIVAVVLSLMSLGLALRRTA
jgi:uncharacterized protein YcnI